MCRSPCYVSVVSQCRRGPSSLGVEGAGRLLSRHPSCADHTFVTACISERETFSYVSNYVSRGSIGVYTPIPVVGRLTDGLTEYELAVFRCLRERHPLDWIYLEKKIAWM